MQIKPGDKLPIVGFYFSRDWEPVVPSDTPTIDILATNLSTFIQSTVISAQDVTVKADGEIQYNYTTPSSGSFAYTIKITSTDNTLDQQIIILPTMMSGGWLVDIETKIDAVQTDLDNPNQYKADVSSLATAAALTTIDGKIDIIDGIVDTINTNLAALTAEYDFLHDEDNDKFYVYDKGTTDIVEEYDVTMNANGIITGLAKV